jgi:hypothetical protein
VRNLARFVKSALTALRQRLVARYLAAKEKPYAAIFLDKRSQQELLHWWKAVVRIPLHGDVKAHHVTLVYDPSPKEAAEIPLKARVNAKVVGWAADHKGQAVLVRTPLRSKNAYPHVTVAVAPGISAVYSNELLSKAVTTMEPGPNLFGVVDIRTE